MDRAIDPRGAPHAMTVEELEIDRYAGLHPARPSFC
jgi:hypothetical protein